jgi:hypothetical protein
MKRLLIWILVLVSFNAYATWVVKMENDESTTYFYQKKSYKTLFGSYEYAQIVNLKKPRVIQGEAYMSIRGEFELDCKNKKMRDLSIKYFSGEMASGSVVTKTSSKGTWFGATSRDIEQFCH